jgi:hypothetical protein
MRWKFSASRLKIALCLVILKKAAKGKPLKNLTDSSLPSPVCIPQNDIFINFPKLLVLDANHL